MRHAQFEHVNQTLRGQLHGVQISQKIRSMIITVKENKYARGIRIKLQEFSQ